MFTPRRMLIVSLQMLLVLTLIPISAHAQKAFSVALSNWAVEGQARYTLGEEGWVNFTVQDGRMFRLEFVGGHNYAFVPKVGQQGSVEFTVYEIVRRSDGAEEVQQLGEPISTGKGGSFQAPTQPVIEIEVTGIERRQFSAPIPEDPNSVGYDEGLTLDAMGGGCCISCGGLRTCGCSVSTSCGSCCSDDCCFTESPEILNKN